MLQPADHPQEGCKEAMSLGEEEGSNEHSADRERSRDGFHELPGKAQGEKRDHGDDQHEDPLRNGGDRSGDHHTRQARAEGYADGL
jgi:hypothetical protein